MLDELLHRFAQHERRALAQLLTLLSRGEELEPILASLATPARRSQVIAVTGSGGVGKSSLIGKLIEHWAGQGQKLAVLACDPQSPLTGGALLGDRFRMAGKGDDERVFIRSLAALSGRGAIAEFLGVMILVVEAFGFGRIIIETVGAGQGDTAVRDLADAVVVLLQPETGDELQWEKAGLMEIADVIVIHKADLPGADRTEAQVRSMLEMTPGRSAPVLRVSAASGQGVAELAQTIAGLPLRRGTTASSGRELLALAEDVLGARFAGAADDAALQCLLTEWRQGKLTPGAACTALLRLLAESTTVSPRASGER